jgi:hypothetical protein
MSRKERRGRAAGRPRQTRLFLKRKKQERAVILIISRRNYREENSNTSARRLQAP